MSARGCDRFICASCQENLNTFKSKCVRKKWGEDGKLDGGGSDERTQNLSDDVLRLKVG